MKNNLYKIEEYLNENFISMNGSLPRLLLLSLISGIPCLINSKPGNGKTSLVKNMLQFFESSFEISMNEETTTSELIGPLDMKKLSEGIEERMWDHGFTFRHAWLIDEVDKAPSYLFDVFLQQLENNILRIGDQTIETPTIFKVFCSNTIPEDESIQAFLSRIGIKYQLDDLNFNQLIELQRLSITPPPQIKLKANDVRIIQEELNERSKTILQRLSIEDLKQLEKVLQQMQLNFTLSHRKLIHWVKLATAISWYQEEDFCLNHLAEAGLYILWDKPYDIEAIEKLMMLLMDENQKKIFLIQNDFSAAKNDLEKISRGELENTHLPLVIETFKRVLADSENLEGGIFIKIRNEAQLKINYLIS